MKSVSLPYTAASKWPPRGWRRWLFPFFWALMFGIGLLQSVLALAATHSELLTGWSGVGLSVLVVGIFGGYIFLAVGWLYRESPLSPWLGLMVLGALLVLQLIIFQWFGPAFAWIGLALLYPVIGGLPSRFWPLPILGLLLTFTIGALPTSAGEIDLQTILNLVWQMLVNIGIALGIRIVSSQHNQLRQAHAALAANAAQQEELAVLRERSRLARAMHDDIGHALVVMNVKLEAAQLLYARDPARGDAELEATRTLIRATMADLRRTLADLRSPDSIQDDLTGALQRLAQEMQARTTIAVSCCIAPDSPAIPPEAREPLWYVAREALTNVERHAAATHVTLTLKHDANQWLLQVEDDGAGTGPADLRRPGHYGVLGMRERMHELGGELRIERGRGGGTLVEAQLPVQIAQKVAA